MRFPATIFLNAIAFVISAQTIEEKLELGWKQYHEGKYHDAITTYDAILKEEEQNAHAYFFRSMSKFNTNDLHGAIEDMEKAIQLDEASAPKGFYNLGYYYFQLQDYEGSVLALDVSISLDPTNADAWLNRGYCKLILNRDGCEDLKKAVELGSKTASEYHRQYCQ